MVTTDDAPGAYRFVHALTRETLYGDLRPGRRARRHAARRRDALARRLPSQPDLVTEVAHHHGRAAASTTPTWSARGRARPRGAPWRPRRGARSWRPPSSGRAPSTSTARAPEPDPERRHRLLLDAAIARQRLGDIRGAQAVLDEALDRARADRHHRRMAEAATGFRSFGVWHWRDLGVTDPATTQTILECLDAIDDLGLQAQLWASLSVERFIGYDSPGAAEAGERSIEVARASGDAEALQFCLEFRCIALYLPGCARDLEEVARSYLALGLAAEREIAARFHLAVALHRQGRVAESDDEIAVAFRLQSELRHTGCDVPLAWWRWLRALETADADADEIGRQALALHRRTSVVGLEELTGLTLLEREPASGAVPPDIVVSAEQNPNRSYHVYVAHALARSGDHDGALRLMGPLPPAHENDYASHFAHCLRVEVLVLAGRLDLLPEALARISPYLDEMADYGSVLSAGSTGYFTGIAHEALGDLDTAAAHLERAVAVNEAAGHGRWVSHSARALARVRAAPEGGKATASRT